MQESYLSFKNVNKKIIEKIIKDNEKYIIAENKHMALICLIRIDKLVIHIYANDTILLQGSNIKQFALKYNLINSVKEIKELPSIGCDEVGVGDFFGPLITCCAFLEKNFKEKYSDLAYQIQDSKKISDGNIKNIYWKIKDIVTWQVCIFDNNTYNKLYEKYQNVNTLKALCHNKALLKLFDKNKHLKNEQIIMDQFASEKIYYNHLKNEKEIVQNIHFETKAESKYISVACASIIARYHFLEYIEKLEKQFNLKLPLGASNDVKAFVNKYKKEKPNDFSKFTKVHFNSEIK